MICMERVIRAWYGQLGSDTCSYYTRCCLVLNLPFDSGHAFGVSGTRVVLSATQGCAPASCARRVLHPGLSWGGPVGTNDVPYGLTQFPMNDSDPRITRLNPRIRSQRRRHRPISGQGHAAMASSANGTTR